MKKTVEKVDESRTEVPLLTVHWKVLKAVVNTIGGLRAESGGAIGGNGDGTEITHFHFDESSRSSAVTYSPDHNLLNRLFKTEWNPAGIRLRGFIHSHPGYMNRPSYGDEVYAERILKAIDDIGSLWLPIVNSVPDTGGFTLTPWVVYLEKRGVSVVRGKIQITHVPAHSSFEACGKPVSEMIQEGAVVDEIVLGSPKRSYTRGVPVYAPAFPMGEHREAESGPDTNSTSKARDAVSDSYAKTTFDVSHTFDRVQGAYDLDLMRKSRVIAVGAGGAADWLEQLARAGISQFVMIDPDVVSETNLATQQTYRRDIGRPKVDCIAERIRDINPTARTIALQKSLDDLDDEEIRRLALSPIDGRETGKTVICGLTDSFFAQARVNRLALHLGLPSMCAQVYREGRGSEITFTYPGVTPACHRCILSSRYRHFLEQGQTNDVTSHGTPIFATTRLNAIKGFIMLALLHHGSGHLRWGDLLSRIGKRNLVQVRMDPDFAETMGISVFNRVFEKADTSKLLFDEAVWLPEDQECPDTGYAYHCPDCGGTGDLRDAIGRFADTRLTEMARSSKTTVMPIAASTRRAVLAYEDQNRRMS